MPAKTLFLPLLLFIALSCFGQQDSLYTGATKNAYQDIDNLARTKKYNGDLRLLVSQLTDNYSDDTSKARAVFVWIADNIAYDYKAFNKKKHYKMPKCKKGDDCLKVVAEWKEDYTDKVLRSGKSVCDGYAWLFKRMCDYAGLQTDFVHGYTKHSPDDVGRMGSLDHAWNGIVLDGKYYYLDVTWASGHCPKDEKGKLEAFKKRFDDFYWLTPIEKFCINHYPKDSESPGVATYSKERYRDNPYIYGAYRETQVISPTSGVIEAKVGDTIHFKIDNSQFAIDLEYSTNTNVHPYIDRDNDRSHKHIYDSDKNHHLPVKREGDIYSFDYVVANSRLRYIEIYNFYMLAYKFKVKIVR